MIPRSLSLVLPAYNEAENLPEVASEAIEALQAGGLDDFEIIIVDDGSTDATRRVAEELAQASPCIRVISHDRNRGLGAAVTTGFGAARMAYACRMDADGQMRTEDVVALLRRGFGADMIISAYSARDDAKPRLLLSWARLACVWLLFGFSYRLQGAYLIKTSVFHQLDPVLTTGHIAYELLAKVRMSRGTLFEGMMRCWPRQHGASKVCNARTIWRSLSELLKLRVHLIAWQRIELDANHPVTLQS